MTPLTMQTREENERESLEEMEEDHAEDSMKIQPWKKQVTVRAIIVSVFVGSVYSVIATKMNLTTGIMPNLNISAALVSYVVMRVWTKMAEKAGIVSIPFTRQENTMIQTCSVACYSIAIAGGFGSYLLALNKKTYLMAGISNDGNSQDSYKEPAIGWMTGYLFLTCFVGLFVLIPLRKILIVDYNLTYPSGTATAVLINGFHAQGDHMAKKQVRGFMRYLSLSFFWGFFQWFYTGKGGCGFSQFPSLGLQAWKHTFYFDFSMTYVGTGMICPHNVNLSLLFGAVISWGIMWPLIGNLKGEWFDADLPESSMKSLGGYRSFISIALILGDGIYNFIKILYFTSTNLHNRIKHKNTHNSATNIGNKSHPHLTDDEIFIKDTIPLWVAATGYILFAIMAVIFIPFIFPELKWYYIIIAYILAPSLAFSNAYGAGLTDYNMAYNYGKVALFMLAALGGKEHGVVAGLAGCGLIKSIVSVSCTLMLDLKTSHLTLTSPRAMVINQVIGVFIGCIVAPLSFMMFYKTFDVGNPNGEFKAPFAIIYRNLAVLGVQGFSALPRHCLELCYGFFAFAVVINFSKDFLPSNIGKWLPLPMAMGVPFIIGGYFAIDMCVGTLVVFLWHKLNHNKAKLMVPAVASGLICGEGLWILPSSILALAKIKPPICMKFFAS